MQTYIDSLKSFIEKVKCIGFFERLFYWKNLRYSLIDAAAGLSGLVNQVNNLQTEKNNSSVQLATAKEMNNGLQAANHTLQIEVARLQEKLENLDYELRTVQKEYLLLKQEDEFRRLEHSNAMATLQHIKEQIVQERQKEVEDRTCAEMARIRQLKETWYQHQTGVRTAIKTICNKHTIEYVEAVPFKGEPDNALKLCDEYIVFDAKSPGNDDLTNFPYYIKDQAEKAKKYAKQEHVKTDIFFVVPSNTLAIIAQHTYHLGDFNVYVVSVDSLEPIILCLKKIEAYEFAEQLSPEERDNICRIVGKFAHLAKRRIQVDSFFARQFIELAYKCENDLPEDILDKVIEFEKSEKLNPPMEKRAKTINTKELEKDAIRMVDEAGSRGILIEDVLMSTGLNGLPLYKQE